MWAPAGNGAAARVDSGVEIRPAGWSGPALEPGKWNLLAFVSSAPQDLAAAGWRLHDGVFARGFDGAGAGGSLCLAAIAPCDGRFGAQSATLEVQPAPVAKPPPAPAPPPVAKPPPAPAPNEAACARIIQQMSLGDTSAALSERFRALGCR
ncbi:MAG: hypothetical protein KF788_00440 [Piscinibacter sp.]|nr:hypothetical protein [Piscinibacter sp.]